MYLQNLRYTLRGFQRDPLYAIAIVATLALTLGASTTVFSIVNGVLLRPLPYPDSDQLVTIEEVIPQGAGQYPALLANLRHFDLWRDRATTFESMGAMDWRTMNLSGAGEPFQATVLRASGTLLGVLHTHVTVGRPLNRTDEDSDKPRVVVISDELWAQRFGRDIGVVGRTLTLGGTDHTIVGVLPQRFEIPSLNQLASLSSRFSAIVPLRLDLTSVAWIGSFNYTVIARMRPGVPAEQARAELDTLQQTVLALARKAGEDAPALHAQVTPLNHAIVGHTRPALLLLLGAVIGVVLIACANLANLSLSRTVDRLRYAAIHTALGASRGHLIRTVVLEQLVLALIGGALGVLVALQALRVFLATAPIDLPRVGDVVIDAHVLAFAAAIAFLAGLAVAWLPAWRIAGGNLVSALRSGGHGSTDRIAVHARGALLVTQVALSVALLVMTGLFVTSLMRLLAVDPGFSTDGVLAVEISPTTTRYSDTSTRVALYDRIAERARHLPGVTSVAWTSALPLTGDAWVDTIARPDDLRPDSQKPEANYRFVGPDYFRTLSIPILQGRSFGDRDRTNAITPAVISARAAQMLWPEQDPIGKQFNSGDATARFEVAGIVVDGRHTALDIPSPLMVYLPYWYSTEGKSILLARTGGAAEATIRALRSTIRTVDPALAIGDAQSLQAVVHNAIGGRRHQAVLFMTFGVAALTIATIGVYATTAYGVSRRRREMNIRVALGASPSRVFALVLRQSVTPLFIGIGVGCTIAVGAGDAVRSLLFEVGPRDPMVLALVVSAVAGVGVVAAVVAARRGLHVDPATALRAE